MIATVLLLLVEDEPLILDMMQCVFEDAGYRIEVAVDGASAMALIDAHIDEAAGLVTDVRLGSGPDGWDVARHARHKKPDMPVVYMTGDSAANWAAEGVPKSLLLMKPFAPAQAITAISTLLDEASSSPPNAL